MTRPWSGSFSHRDTTTLTGLPLSNPLKNRFREKRWCYAGVVSPDLFFGAAVVHLGYMTSAFAFGFDRSSGQMTQQTLTWPPLGHVRYDRHPEKGTCRFKGLGKHIEIRSLPDGLSQRILVRLKSIEADLTLFPPETGFSPMHFPMNMGAGKRAFTTKAAGLAARGSIALNGKAFTLDPDTASGLFDWTHGAYPRSTFWNWACGTGRATSLAQSDPPVSLAVSLGFNFSRGVYERGILENTLWIDGQPEPVPEVEFNYDPDSPEAPWQITSADQRIQLAFFPEGARSANDNFIFLASRFTQPCGRFEGEITCRGGRTFTLTSAAGVVEEHYAKW